MIKLESTKLIIEVPGPAADNWAEITSDLLDLLYCEDQNFINRHQGIYLLLQHMMPAPEQIKIKHEV